MLLSVPAASTPSVVRPAAASASSTRLAPNVLIVVLAGNDNVLMSASTSLSINAPAAVTLAVLVTSAPSSIKASLLMSVAVVNLLVVEVSSMSSASKTTAPV